MESAFVFFNKIPNILMKKINLKGLTLEELKSFSVSLEEKPYRGNQLFDWLYNKRANSIDSMTTLSKEFREKLKIHAHISDLKIINSYQSKFDGTRKFLFELEDGNQIESVLIPPKTAFYDNESMKLEEQKRLTVCVSTQVGCPLDCVFCATGTMGFKRNLSTGEIIDQVMQIEKFAERKITNIVFMGMGEPFLNYDNVIKAIKIFIDGMNIAARRITLSTAGWIDGIFKLAEENLKIKLAISLHTMKDEIRDKLIPINKRYNLSKLLEAVEYYYKKTKLRVTFEYIVFKNLNDKDDDVKMLTKLARSIPCKINLIPFHSITFVKPAGIEPELKPATMQEMEKFAQKLRKNNLTVFIRSSAGEDITAACGQLAIKSGK